MKLRSLIALTASAALFLSAGRASAEEEDPGLRLRYGLAFGAGLVLAPHTTTHGIFGAYGQFGLQFNNSVGLYLAPYGCFVPSVPTSCFGASALGELTFGGLISAAIGPELGWYGGDLRGYKPPIPAYYPSALYGGRLHLAWHVVPKFGGDTSPFNLTVSLDVRLLGGRTLLTVTEGTGPAFVALSVLTIGPEKR